MNTGHSWADLKCFIGFQTFNEIQEHVITILETTRKFLIRYKIIDGNELYHASD
jgi:hypothetical protein